MKSSIITKFFSQVWRDELVKINTALLKKPISLPWMRSREIDILVELLTNLKPKRSLEWGAGYSSKYFSQFLPTNFEWHSIEHNKDWSETAKNLVSNPNIHIHYVPSNAENDAIFNEKNDGNYTEFKNYLEYPSQLGLFDFIFIDGRARVECVKKAASLLTENGVILLHDANRKHYQSVFTMFKESCFLGDNRTNSGGIWIATNGNPKIDTILNIEFNKQLWQFYTTFSKFIKV